MTREEIISGLKFTVEMFLLDPSTGETITEPRNDMDKTTIDACRGAIELLEQESKTGHWIWQTEDIYRCSECGEDIHVKEVMNVPQYKWCPMCGAKMVEPQNLKYADNDTMMPAT